MGRVLIKGKAMEVSVRAVQEVSVPFPYLFCETEILFKKFIKRY